MLVEVEPVVALEPAVEVDEDAAPPDDDTAVALTAGASIAELAVSGRVEDEGPEHANATSPTSPIIDVAIIVLGP